MQSVNIELLSKNVALTVTRRTFNNSRKADISKVSTGEADETAAKSRLKLSKKLLESPQLDAINEHLAAVYKWVEMRSMPSGFKPGIYLVKLTEVANFEKAFGEACEKLYGELLPAFAAAYPEQIEAARSLDISELSGTG
jgi:hypothetical protein